MLEYETANPGQDFDEHETKIFDPERDVDRPMVNFVAPGNANISPSAQSRPITGDTLSGYRREEIPLEQLKSEASGQQTPASAAKASRRESSLMPAITKESEDLGAAGNGDDDIVHGGAHHSETANKLDPRVQTDSEPAKHVARSAGRA